MSAVRDRVRRTIRRHGLCPPGARVLVGLSGGSDSVALTFLLGELAPSMGFSVAGLAHVNHQLRRTADRDETFCAGLAARLSLPFVGLRADVRRAAADGGLSLEDAARRVRYELLGGAASELDATRVAVAHTLDDQAETFLLKLLRGAGPTGLGGIYPARDLVIRPALEVSRAELRDYLLDRGESWVEDETNADVSNPRNRIRHQVLPVLEAALGLPARRAIARAAGLLGEDARWLDALAAEKLEEIAVEGDRGLSIDVAGLLALPPPLARRVLLQALRSRANGREVVLEHIQAALDVASGLAGAAEVPGVRLELRGKKLVLIQ